MPQAYNHIKWCLNKAKKEIEECKKLGKNPKHRGLLKITPDINKARSHIKKAEHNLNAIRRFKEIGFSDWSIAAGFYSIYHCFLAIAAKFGYESRNQTCTIALMDWLKEEGKINIDERFVDMLRYEDIGEAQESSVIDMREEYTYGAEISFENETEIKELIETCREMIDIAKRIVFEQL